MSGLIPETVKDAANVLFGDSERESTTRATIVGTWLSGKTTVLSCFGIACQLLSAQDPKFSWWPDERQSGIREFWSLLRRGRFPPSTTPGSYYENSILLEWKRSFGTSQKVNVPCCETAGEDIHKLIGTFIDNPYKPRSMDLRLARTLFEYILRSDGFILVGSAAEALIYGDRGKERGPKDLSSDEKLAPDPDLNLARITDAIYKYRKKTYKKPIKGMAIMLTKYDRIKTEMEAQGMDLYNAEGAKAFMDTYFPQTMDNLKSFKWTVEYFPVYVDVETDDNDRPLKWEDGSGDKILLNYDTRLPVFTDLEYLRFIDWLKDKFA